VTAGAPAMPSATRNPFPIPRKTCQTFPSSLKNRNRPRRAHRSSNRLRRRNGHQPTRSNRRQPSEASRSPNPNLDTRTQPAGQPRGHASAPTKKARRRPTCSARPSIAPRPGSRSASTRTARWWLRGTSIRSGTRRRTAWTHSRVSSCTSTQGSRSRRSGAHLILEYHSYEKYNTTMTKALHSSGRGGGRR
jgi:hypothetical protein